MPQTYPFLDLKAINRPYMAEMEREMAAVVSSGRYMGGERNETLERTMADLCEVKHAVGVSNGLDGLTLILQAWRTLGLLREGDGVIVPANTYIASFLAITRAGLTPVPVDCDPDTYNLDADAITADDLKRARAVMVVHLYGRNAWTAKLRDIAVTRGLLVIEDTAQSIGAHSSTPGLGGSHMTGGLGHAAAFSFYPTKNIGAVGDAGMVTTDSEELAKTVRALANYGSDYRYHNIYIGSNCRLDPVQAAAVSVKLPSLSEVSRRRRENAAAYAKAITNPLLTLPQIPANPEEHVWHQYVVSAGSHRDSLRAYLAERGVDTDIHYPVPPMHQPCYADFPGKKDFPVTDKLASEILSLPISQATSVSDITAISQIINEFTPSV